MARKKVVFDDDYENSKEGKQYKEAELVLLFGLKRIVASQTPLMQEWLTVANPDLDSLEQRLFDKKLLDVQEKLSGWSEEDLKMKFIATILEL